MWFYDMQADGFSLDQRRNPIDDNDIPDIEARFGNLKAEESRSRKDKSFLVPIEEIRANDYSLSINKYKEIVRENVEYESCDVILERLVNREKEIMAAMDELNNKLLSSNEK